MQNNYDVIVIGGGHAGVEAALSSSRLGKKTAMFTIFLDNIAMMSCNPAIGGPGKSHIISELGVLGAEIAKHTDEYNIQLKHLNVSKGAAARITRAQADKFWYRTKMKEKLERQENLDCIQDLIDELIIDAGKVIGVKSSLGIEYYSKTVIIATGTFLKGRIVVGEVKDKAGRQGEISSEKLSESLSDNGILLKRFQTATPPRIDKNSIDFSKVKEMKGEENPNFLSIFTKKRENKNLATWLTYTNEKTVKKVEELLKYSPIVTGMIDSKGPRHCPSIDRKVINFPEKKDHQIFLEQESIESTEIYVNGLTTSMPPFAQDELIKTITGLENAKIMRYAYAIEYDYAPPFQLYPSLESKKIENLYFAGQINGSSGYEEAAAQGFMAGVNAARKVDGREAIVIDRSEGYIGVLIDDLINKKLLEPYRVLPSRSEYRLTLRQDNAYMRLYKRAKEINIISEEEREYLDFINEATENEIKRLKIEKIYPTIENNLMLEGMNEELLKKSVLASELLKRNTVNYKDLKYFINIREYPEVVIDQVETYFKYEDFIVRENENIKKFKILEEKKIPFDIDYNSINALSNLAKDNLKKVKPFSIGQASRISGIGANDIAILIAYLQ